jgi:hypothetical protein
MGERRKSYIVRRQISALLSHILANHFFKVDFLSLRPSACN